jgi:hypothetical protein
MEVSPSWAVLTIEEDDMARLVLVLGCGWKGR